MKLKKYYNIQYNGQNLGQNVVQDFNNYPTMVKADSIEEAFKKLKSFSSEAAKNCTGIFYNNQSELE